MKKQTRPRTLNRQLKKTTKSLSPLVVLLSLMLLTAMLYGLKQYFKPTLPEIAEIRNNSGTISLSLSPQSRNLNLGESTTVYIQYDSPTEKFLVGSLEIAYDPATLEISEVKNGSDFPSEMAAPTIVGGKIKFAYGVVINSAAGKQGTGTFASFKVKALKAGDTNISFTAQSSVAGFTSTGNALREVTNTTLTLVDPSASPSPSASSTNTQDSPSPSPSPSASTSTATSPSPSPSAAASVEPSSSPETSPSVAPSTSTTKPSAPNNLKYNCYSNGTRITLRWDDVGNVSGYEIVFDQKDGDNDQTTSSTRAEKDLDIKSNAYYNWRVYSVKDGVKSDASSVSDIKCNSGDSSSNSSSNNSSSSNSTPTPTPAPTKKPNPITSAINNITKPKTTPKPSVKASPSASPTLSTPTPTPGSLSDIFAGQTPAPTTPQKQPGFFKKILLGWQALIERIIALLTN